MAPDRPVTQIPAMPERAVLRSCLRAHGPNRCTPDDVGEGPDDLAAARELAFETIRDMARDPCHRGDHRHWAMHLKDEEGRTFVPIPFLMAMSVERARNGGRYGSGCSSRAVREPPAARPGCTPIGDRRRPLHA